MKTQTARQANISVDREVWKQAKSAAALQDRTLADFVEAAIREALEQKVRARRRKSKEVNW